MAGTQRVWTRERFLAGTRLGWCACLQATEETRVEAVRRALEHVHGRFNTSDQVTVTDLGAGKLLQSFLLVRDLLARGYQRLDLNLIDTDYPRDRCGRRAVAAGICGQLIPYTQRPLPPDHELKALHGESIDDLFGHLATLTRAHGAQIDVHVYQSPVDYLSACDEGQARPSDVLWMVDPGDEPVLATPEQANMLGGWASRARPDQQDVLVYLPENGAPALYHRLDPRSGEPDRAAKNRTAFAPDGCDPSFGEHAAHRLDLEDAVHLLRERRGASRPELVRAFAQRFDRVQFYSDPQESFRRLALAANRGAFTAKVVKGIRAFDGQPAASDPEADDPSAFGRRLRGLFGGFDIVACEPRRRP